MSEIGTAVYHERALQLANAMMLCRDDLSAYAAAAALLAVHSAISYNDAILITLTGQRPRGSEHSGAVVAIRKACGTAKVNTQGVEHLSKLLCAKTDVSYGDHRVSNEKAEALCVLAERFQTWAEGPEADRVRIRIWRRKAKLEYLRHVNKRGEWLMR